MAGLIVCDLDFQNNTPEFLREKLSFVIMGIKLISIVYMEMYSRIV